MDLLEIIEKKNQLTRDIYRLVKSFHEETGVVVDDLGYRLLNVTEVGASEPQYEIDLNIKIII